MGVLRLSDRISRNIFGRYGAALAATAMALMARRALDPLLGDSLPYVTLFPAVAFSAWLCGVGPSLLAVFAGLLGARYWFQEPQHALSIPGTPQAAGMAVYALTCGVVAAIGELARRHNKMLRLAQGDLEEMVKQRTAELDAANRGLSELTAR